MYSKEVQEYIERHIDLIDKEDWDQLLRLTMGPNENDFLTDIEVQELINCLADAGILIMGEVRLKILFNIIQEALEDYFDNNDRGNIPFFLSHYMENFLGLNLGDVYHFVSMNMDDLNIKYDDQGIIIRRS